MTYAADRSEAYLDSVLAWVAGAGVTDLVLACAGCEPDPASVPTVVHEACVADLPSDTYADLALAGLRTLRVAGCPDGADLLGHARKAAAPVETVLSVTGDVTAGRGAIIRRGSVPLPRRGLLRRRVTPGRRVEHAPGSGRMARLGETLRALDVVPDRGTPAGVRLAARGCTACGVCVQACPTGSLALEPLTAAGSLALAHVSGTCDGAQRCVALCPENALTVVGPAAWGDVVAPEPVPLARVAVAVCTRCGARYPSTSGTELCPVCRDRAKDPFGSYLPPAALELLRRNQG